MFVSMSVCLSVCVSVCICVLQRYKFVFDEEKPHEFPSRRDYGRTYGLHPDSESDDNKFEFDPRWLYSSNGVSLVSCSVHSSPEALTV